MRTLLPQLPQAIETQSPRLSKLHRSMVAGFFRCQIETRKMAKMSSRMFSRRQRCECRDIAKRSIETANWDEAKAKDIAETAARREFGSIWVTVAIAIIFKLIEWWLKRRRADPTFTIPNDWDELEPGSDPNENVVHVPEPHADMGEFD